MILFWSRSQIVYVILLFYHAGPAEKKKPKKKKKRKRCEEEEEEELTGLQENLNKCTEIGAEDGQKHKMNEPGSECQSLQVDLKDCLIAQIFLFCQIFRSKRPAGEAGGGGDLPGPNEETEEPSGSRSGKTSSKQL